MISGSLRGVADIFEWRRGHSLGNVLVLRVSMISLGVSPAQVFRRDASPRNSGCHVFAVVLATRLAEGLAVGLAVVLAA